MNPLRAAALLLALQLCTTGCDPKTGGARGEDCTRSVQCDPGLACIEGACTHDISDLGELAFVPDLMPGTDAGLDAALDDDAGN